MCSPLFACACYSTIGYLKAEENFFMILWHRACCLIPSRDVERELDSSFARIIYIVCLYCFFLFPCTFFLHIVYLEALRLHYTPYHLHTLTFHFRSPATTHRFTFLDGSCSWETRWRGVKWNEGKLKANGIVSVW